MHVQAVLGAEESCCQPVLDSFNCRTLELRVGRPTRNHDAQCAFVRAWGLV
jgi:hypothetical protein